MNAKRKRAVAGLFAMAAVGAVTVVAMLIVVPALATPPSNATVSLIAKAAQVGESKAKAKIGDWKAKVKTKGLSDLYVIELTIQPGGDFGWHSHPGLEFAIVKSGTATYYHGDDPTCTPHVVPAGSGVGPASAGSVHIVRNEGSVPLVIVGTLVVKTGAAPRTDEPDPGNCSF